VKIMATDLYYRTQRWWKDHIAGWGSNKEIAAADNREERDTKFPSAELGTTGLDVRGGNIYQEYNYDLQSLSSRMVVYEEMRRSESALAAIEQIITLPIRQADWRIELGDDKNFGEFVRWNLFEGLSHSFDDLLREVLLAPLYGFTIHEKVFEDKSQGYLGWRKFAERARRTVTEWQFDRTGGLEGIVQTGIRPDNAEMYTVEIPIKKLIVWTWRKESGNPEGIGAFRQAYKHWRYKQAFEEFAAIRIERQAMGMPKATQPPGGAPQTEVDAVAKLLQRIRTAHDSGLLIPDGWLVDMLNLGPADVPFESHIERQHQSILQTVLGQFVGLGQGGDTGAWALSKDSSSFFLMGLETIADWMASYFNRYCVAQLARYNALGDIEPPRLVHGPLGVRDPDVISSAISKLFDPKLQLPENIEEYMRAELGLPDRDPDDVREQIVVEEAKDGSSIQDSE